MKLAGSQIFESAEILKKLTGPKGDDGKSPFRFQPVLKVALSKLLRTLVETGNDINDLRTEKIEELQYIGEDGKPKDDPKILAQLQKFWNEVLAAEYEVEVRKLKISYFNLDANDIPVTYLAALDWLLDVDLDENDFESFMPKKAVAAH